MYERINYLKRKQFPLFVKSKRKPVCHALVSKMSFRGNDAFSYERRDGLALFVSCKIRFLIKLFKAVRGFYVCPKHTMKIWLLYLLVSKLVFKTIFWNSPEWLSHYRISKASILINTKDPVSMECIAKGTFSPVTVT